MAFARFHAVPYYAYMKLKMLGLNGPIIICCNAERSLRTEEQTVAFAAKAQATEAAKSRASSSGPEPAKRQKSTRDASNDDSGIPQTHLADKIDATSAAAGPDPK